jgi:hypothetical protein
LLFHERGDLVAIRTKPTDQGFGLGVARHGNREVSVARKPRFRPDRYRQAANEGEVDVRPRQGGGNPVEG